MDCGLYVHFPWCATRCTYCDFNTYVVENIPAERYTAAIVAEGEDRVGDWNRHRLQTIYFGGGTPSLWGAEGVGAVIQAAQRWFSDRSALEITLECNPAEATPEALAELREAGVNRLSLGVQSLDDGILSGLGRRHNSDTARTAIANALAAGFDSVSADLMFGLPDQSLDRWRTDLAEVLDTGVPHLSVYHLTLEAGTAMTRDVGSGRIELPTDDTQADMWEAIPEAIAPYGLALYEVSSASKPGHESRHNTLYWSGRPYLGLGAGAHSLRLPASWDTPDATADRQINRKHHLSFVSTVETAGSAVETTDAVDQLTHLRERMFTGLRRLEGLSLSAVALEVGLDPATHFAPVLADLQAQGLLTREDDRVALTRRGLQYADDVFVKFF